MAIVDNPGDVLTDRLLAFVLGVLPHSDNMNIDKYILHADFLYFPSTGNDLGNCCSNVQAFEDCG